MTETTDTSTDGPITELDLATATGVWLVGSASATRYYLNLDGEAAQLLRQPGAGSSTGAYDGVWVEIVSVACSVGGRGRIVVGARHEYLTDPAKSSSDYRYWIQRMVLLIEPVPADQVPVGRAPEPGEMSRGYGRMPG